MKRFGTGYLFVLPLVFGWPVCMAGCGSDATRGNSVSQSSDAVGRRDVGEPLFASAIDMLDRTDEYDEGSTDAAVAQFVRRLNESLDILQPGTSATPLTEEDGKVLRELVWLHDCARHAVGEETDPLRRGERLFDWVVRNTQQIPQRAIDDGFPAMLPWHALLLGRASQLDQAWLFQLLARQQQLDVAILAYPDSKSDESPRWWCAALCVDGRLYLFDFRIGLPIAGPDGQGVATLEQVIADDKLLRAYDRPDRPYPVKAADVTKMAALFDLSQAYTAPQMARLESQLPSAEWMELAVDGEKLRERIGKYPNIVEVSPWPMRDLRYQATRKKDAYEKLGWLLMPFRLPDRSMPIGGRIMAPPLWKARVRHICGKFVDPFMKRSTINRLYHDARPPDTDINQTAKYEEMFDGLKRMKQNATYWLGLVAYELGNYEAAANYFDIVLKDSANGAWTLGARYNLGRTYEAMAASDKPGDDQAFRRKAVETYRATFQKVEPDELCLQRARRLAE